MVLSEGPPVIQAALQGIVQNLIGSAYLPEAFCCLALLVLPCLVRVQFQGKSPECAANGLWAAGGAQPQCCIVIVHRADLVHPWSQITPSGAQQGKPMGFWQSLT